MKDKQQIKENPDWFPYTKLPRLAHLQDWQSYPSPPDDSACFSLWRKYNMPDNIQRHSLMVARVASAIAHRAHTQNIAIDVAATRASALLHDIAKFYCLQHGGSHAILGAAWMVNATAHYGLAQGILLHVHWPWKLPDDANICSLPIIVLYADKRVRHDACVTLKERFDDLFTRYGHTEEARMGISLSYEQSVQIEKLLSAQLGCDLNEYSFNSGRLVD